MPHKDLRRARAGGSSLIPTSTGSAKAIIKIFPELEGRLDGMAVRVPLLTGSLVDFVFTPEKETNVEEVNRVLKEAAEEGPLKGILGFEEKPLVSSDYCGDDRSGIVDALSTMSVGDKLFKILIWCVFFGSRYFCVGIAVCANSAYFVFACASQV